MQAEFVHLRMHSEYSLNDGIVRIPAAVAKAADYAMPALAISDRMNMFGLVKFYKQAIGAGVKPLIAADIYLYDDGDSYLFTMFALNAVGYQNIREIISKAYQHNLIAGRAYVKREWIETYAAGVLVLSGGKQGDIGSALLANKPELARQLLARWMALFPQRFYLELQRTNRAGDETYLHAAIELAQEFDCPVVATNDVRFLDQSEYEAHEARVCIHQSRTLNDPRRTRDYSAEQYFKDSAAMAELFADIPEALENTLHIAQRCSVQIELGKNYLPDFPIPDDQTLENYFRAVCASGLERRFAKDICLDAGESPREQSQYWARLDFEIGIILQMGFPGYFLIVMDFIRWAKEQDIPVGPGRGSGAGSLVAYALEITDLDPLRYDLLFERFLNPERISMPDFDVDFCQERRDEVIQYVADTYGNQAVSQIITFGTMAAKAVVRDVARVQGKPYGLADKLSKMIPFAPGMTLAKALEEEPDIQQFLDEDEEAQGIWDMAVQLEGVARNTGKHAAGVVIAPNKLEDFTPVYCVEGEDVLITQFDKDDVEDVGLVKFDFLGLKNLTVIQWALRIINAQSEPQQMVDIAQIPLDDPAVFQLLQKAQTTAVFQLESQGMKELIVRLKPSSFEDIIAMVALYRPGPLESGMVDDFINRKHGRAELAYPHPQFQHECLKPVLKPTYGIILYQEQVMQIAQEMGGYSLGAADMLRRAMGKKKAEEMAKQREQFVDGSVAKGFELSLASNIFDLMEKFAGYGFNKSHSAAYALVAYQTAWLKAHHPAAFMAAVMSADLQNTDKIVTLIEECRHMQLEVLPPDINQGQYLFTVDEHARIIYGLGAIKGLGEGPVNCLIAERENAGAYTDLFDLCLRADSRKLNKRALEALIRSGAMDSLGEARSLLMASLSEAIKAAEQNNTNQSIGMSDLFGDVVSSSNNSADVYAHFRQHRLWPLKQRLQGEKETLGLYLTGHPIDAYTQEIQHLSSKRLSELKKASGQRIFALIIAVRMIRTKRGASMAIVTLDDRSGRVEVAFFSEMYERYRELLVSDEMVVVEGDIDEDKYSGGFKISPKQVLSIEQARARYAKCLRVSLEHSQWSDSQFVADFKAMIQAHCVSDQLSSSSASSSVDDPSRDKPSAVCPLSVCCRVDGIQAELNFGPKWRIKPSDEVLNQLRDNYGDTALSWCY